MPRRAVTQGFAIERHQTAPPHTCSIPNGSRPWCFLRRGDVSAMPNALSATDSPSRRVSKPHPELERFRVSRALGAHHISEKSTLGKLARQHWRPKQQLGTTRYCLRGATLTDRQIAWRARRAAGNDYS
jgi:hypothetical protein